LGAACVIRAADMSTSHDVEREFARRHNLSSSVTWTRGVAAVMVVAVSSSACTATLYRRGMPELDGVTVESSDQSSVVIRKNGVLYRVPGEQISEIDHPGNVLVLLGGLTAALGAGLGVARLANRNPVGQDMTPFVAVYGTLGLGLMLMGVIPWSRSRFGAHRFEQGRVEPAPLPIECAPPAAAPGCPPLVPLDKRALERL
jgi:hypothetical protein